MCVCTRCDIFDLQNLLMADNTLSLNTLNQRIVNICRHGGQDAGGTDNAIQDQLGCNTAGHADQTSHCRGALGVAVFQNRRCAGLLSSGIQGGLGSVGEFKVGVEGRRGWKKEPKEKIVREQVV